ncbi:TRAP transporter large permease [Kordiimonas gwangyangensis]|uniref:TRAP transporter large permease n=1 Tax=Kordiimonas gwangyangensis TaxID=288022 RepID=UPI0003752BD8|nr:TRAP transporter large permease subunit [Kordiimonas gwangyangensis]
MDMSIILVISMFVALVGLLLSGFPVAFTLGGTGLLFGLIGIATGTLDATFLEILPNRLFGNVIRNELLFAIPLFVAMGVMLEKSNVAEDLLENMGRLFGRLRGGLGISVTLVGALLAASTGIVGATVVTMALLSLPTMLRRGYDQSLATGSIAAAGTLGQIIPPSIVLILLADVISSAWQQAQLDAGNFSPSPMSAGELFAGALIPGLILVGFYIIYQVIIAVLKPSSSPAIPREEGEALDAAFYGRLFLALAPPMVLIVAVLGSILAGIATPTEAASVGAIGAIFLGAARLGGKTRLTVILSLAALVGLLVIAATMDLRMSRAVVPDADRMAYFGAALLTILFTIGLGWALLQTHRIGVLGEVMRSTVRISTMIYAILIGAALFSLVFRGLGGDDAIEGMLHGLPGGQWTAILLVMVLMFILGFFLDFIEITFVVVPVVAPALLAMDGTYGPIWLGVLIAMNLQTSFLTPPFGFALFYLRGVVPESVPTIAIYKGVIPFVIIQLLALLLIALEPELVTWLPSKLF